MRLLQAFTLPVLVCGFCSSAFGQVVLHDDFNGAEVDTNLWNITLPVAESFADEMKGVGYDMHD